MLAITVNYKSNLVIEIVFTFALHFQLVKAELFVEDSSLQNFENAFQTYRNYVFGLM